MNISTNQSLPAETDSSLIRAELERLLSHRRFSGARQMSAFLRYIVSETLDGNGNRIKAYTVGVDALGKADDFDAQSDPSVRVLALRLRKSLEAVYTDRPECHAVIAMVVGSYVPRFYKPHAIVSNGVSETLQDPGCAASVGNARFMSSENAGSTLSDDIPDEFHSTNQGLRACDRAFRRPHDARDLHTHGKRPESGSAQAVSVAFLPDSMSKNMRDRVGVIMAVALLFAAWQVSLRNVNAATVSASVCAPQTEMLSFNQADPRAGAPRVNLSNAPTVVLPGRS